MVEVKHTQTLNEQLIAHAILELMPTVNNTEEEPFVLSTVTVIEITKGQYDALRACAGKDCLYYLNAPHLGRDIPVWCLMDQ